MVELMSFTCFNRCLRNNNNNTHTQPRHGPIKVKSNCVGPKQLCARSQGGSPDTAQERVGLPGANEGGQREAGRKLTFTEPLLNGPQINRVIKLSHSILPGLPPGSPAGKQISKVRNLPSATQRAAFCILRQTGGGHLN